MRLVKSFSEEAEAKVDMTPMIDCVFLLLIFFMCAATMTKVDKTAEVELPVASNAAEQKDPSDRGTVNILAAGTIAKDGRIASEEKPFMIYGGLLNDDELQRTIEKQLKIQPGLRLYVRADRRVKFALVRRAMVACANAGVSDVIFGTFTHDLTSLAE